MILSHNHSCEQIIEHRFYLVNQITKTKNEHIREKLKLHLNIIDEMLDSKFQLKGNTSN